METRDLTEDFETCVGLDPHSFFLVNSELAEVKICKAHSGVMLPISATAYRELLYTLTGQKEPSKDIRRIISQLFHMGILIRSRMPIDSSQIRVTKTSIERLFIEITARCNLTCLHCYGNFKPLEQHQLSFSAFIKVVNQAASCGIYRVDMTGGEPLIHPQISSMIQCLQRNGMLYTLFSNMTLLDANLYSLICNYKPEYVVTSVESYRPEIHNNFRMGRYAHEKTVNNIKLLTKAGIKVKVNLVLGAHNIDDFDETVSWLNDLGVSEIVVDTIRVEGRATRNLVADKQKLRKVIKKISQRIEPIDGTYPCGVSTTMAYVASDANLYLCPSLKQQKFLLGNICNNKFSLYDSINALPTRFPEFNRSFCRATCLAGTYCTGGCPASVYNSGRRVPGPDQLYCDRYL